MVPDDREAVLLFFALTIEACLGYKHYRNLSMELCALAPVGRVFVWGNRFLGARMMLDRGTIGVAENRNGRSRDQLDPSGSLIACRSLQSKMTSREPD